PAVAAGRALARIAAAVGAGREEMRRQQLVQGIDHLRDLQVLDLVDRADETAPEIAQDFAPGYFVVGDEIELFLEAGGEIILDVFGKEALEKGDHNAPAV